MESPERRYAFVQAVLVCKVSAKSVRRYLRSGQLRGRYLGGKAGWRIPQSAVQEFMESLPDHAPDDDGSEGKEAA